MLEFVGHRSEFFGPILFTLLLFGKNTQTAFGSVFYIYTIWDFGILLYRRKKTEGLKMQ